MILNIYGETDQNQLNIQMPNITLDRRFRYQIGVHRIYFELNDAKNEFIESLTNKDENRKPDDRPALEDTLEWKGEADYSRLS